MHLRTLAPLSATFLLALSCSSDSNDTGNDISASTAGPGTGEPSTSASPTPPQATTPAAPTQDVPTASSPADPAATPTTSETTTSPEPTVPPAPPTEAGGAGAGGQGGNDGAGAEDDPGGLGGMGGAGGGADAGDMGGSGSGGDPGQAPSGDANPDAVPSPGCGKGGRPADGKVYKGGESWLLFPQGYDGATPMPVLFGFHGCGGTNRGDANRTEYSDHSQGNAFETDYVVAVPLSADSGGCWTYNTDIPRVKALYDELVNNYCVDTSRVFATGHSSGAQFIVQLMTSNHTADAEYLNFKAMAPVAASDYGAHGTVMPVMYIQGQNDNVRGNNGKATVDRFVAGNMCSNNSEPITVAGDGCQSDGTTVDPACVSYADCSAPTIWCPHNDPSYSGTSHGIPCFAEDAMDEFFKSLD